MRAEDLVAVVDPEQTTDEAGQHGFGPVGHHLHLAHEHLAFALELDDGTTLTGLWELSGT